MKLNAGKRVLMFFHWLLSLLLCAAFAAYIIRPEFVRGLYQRVTAGLTSTQVMVIGIAILAIYTVLAVVQASMIFHRGRRADRGFITVDSSDAGKVRIAVSAIEQMVRQSVHSIDGIADMKIAIENLDDAIGINIASTIIGGSHVPTITMNMQRAIRQFVEMNCGVAVRSVSININSVAGTADGQKKRRGKRGDFTPVAQPPVQPQSAPEPAPVAAEPMSEAPVTATLQDDEADEPDIIEPTDDDLPESNETLLGLDRPIQLTLEHSPSGDETAQASETPEQPAVAAFPEVDDVSGDVSPYDVDDASMDER